MTRYTEFGTRPTVTVRVTAKDIVERENIVAVNWSTCGEMPIDEARVFLNHFRRALNFAQREQKRLNIKP